MQQRQLNKDKEQRAKEAKAAADLSAQQQRERMKADIEAKKKAVEVCLLSQFPVGPEVASCAARTQEQERKHRDAERAAKVPLFESRLCRAIAQVRVLCSPGSHLEEAACRG